jgi:pyrroloquinoline quinone biosynthesis protein B
LNRRAIALAAATTLMWRAALSAAPHSPYVLVLGTAQDGGLPQIGGTSAQDEAARRDPARRRLVASLLVADRASGRRWLIDATPDLRQQVERAAAEPPSRLAGGTRPPLFDGIFLTHAHMGHYLGLAQLGREAYGASGVPVWGSARMVEFLARNAPWDQLVKLGNIRPETFTAGTPVALAPGLSVTALAVPHRAEYTDTHGFVVRGPRRALLYIPDIDKWERWTTAIESALREVDVALLDGTFFADGEIPGRSMADIPHPFVAESLLRFAALPESERRKIVFTHLNHTNPATDPASPENRRIEAAGMRVAVEGERLGL